MTMSIESQEKALAFRRFLMVAYGLSEGDIDVFMKVSQLTSTDVEKLAQEVKISKSRVSLILKKLSDVGLLEKTKQGSTTGGRPRYIYKVNKDAVKSHMMGRAEELCSTLREVIKNL